MSGCGEHHGKGRHERKRRMYITLEKVSITVTDEKTSTRQYLGTNQTETWVQVWLHPAKRGVTFVKALLSNLEICSSMLREGLNENSARV
jgi:hypothetical protein